MVKASATIRKSVSSSTTTTTSVLDGRVRKQQPDHEQVEIQMYLSKLRELVPNMPKNRKVSKVEVINNVIDYICDLQTALIDQLHQHPTAAAVIINNNNVVQPMLSMMETSTSTC